jgi:glycosyltransferase involved in cell wall biosynthesis
MSVISGFTLVKDALKQGYPFVEAIAAALPICDEFLVSEGYSTDGTYEVLQRIASLNKKVKVFRQHWPKAKNKNFIGDLTNAIRKKCKYD